ALERFRVVSDFALVNQRLPVGVNEFDRVFDGDDVRALIHIYFMNQCGKRCAFAATRRACDEYESFGDIYQIEELFRQAQFFDRQNLFGDMTKDSADAISLHEDVDAETAHAFERIAEI